MKILDLYRYNIRKKDVEQIVRTGEYFTIRKATRNEGQNCPHCFVFIKPKKEFAIKHEAINLVSVSLKEDIYVSYEEETYKYLGNEDVIIKHIYEDIEGVHKKYILCIPDEVDRVIYKPNFVRKFRLCPPRKLMKKWIEECSIKEKRDPKYWYRYGRVQRCIDRKKTIYSLFQYSKRYKKYPIAAEYLTYYYLKNGSVVGVRVYAVLINGKLSFVEGEENAFEILQDYSKVIKLV